MESSYAWSVSGASWRSACLDMFTCEAASTICWQGLNIPRYPILLEHQVFKYLSSTHFLPPHSLVKARRVVEVRAHAHSHSRGVSDGSRVDDSCQVSFLIDGKEELTMGQA